MIKLNQKGFLTTQGVYVVILVVIFIFAVFRGALVNEDKAVRALQKRGFSEVRITDHDWLMVGVRGCSSKDAAKFIAEVTNPAGERVEVFVCTGWIFKGATV